MVVLLVLRVLSWSELPVVQWSRAVQLPPMLPGRTFHKHQSVNQSINQSVSQSVSHCMQSWHLFIINAPRDINSGINSSINGGIKSSVNSSIYIITSVNQSISQSTNQSINQLTLNTAFNQTVISHDLQFVGSSPGWASLHSGLGQATYTCVPLSTSSIIWYRPRGWSLWLGK